MRVDRRFIGVSCGGYRGLLLGLFGGCWGGAWGLVREIVGRIWVVAGGD